MLVDPAGRPIISEKGIEDVVARQKEVELAILRAIDPLKLTVQEMATVIGNLLNMWLLSIAWPDYQNAVTWLAEEYGKMAERVGQAKMAEARIAQSLDAANQQKKPT